MNTEVSKQIMERFYQCLDELIATNTIRGVNTYCRLYDIDRRNFLAQRKDLNRGWFQVSGSSRWCVSSECRPDGC